MRETMKVEEKLALDAFRNHAESHIVLDQRLCASCEGRPCIGACPAALYARIEETGEMKVEHNGCLECGTCLVICPVGSVSWRYPDGGFGVHYRQG